MRGVNFTAELKNKALHAWLIDNLSTKDVCDKYKCTERSLWRWKAIYNGTIDSLEPKPSKPITPHPNAHTNEEIKNIKTVLRESPYISQKELYEKLKNEYGYSRNSSGLYNYLRKNKIIPGTKPKNKYATMFDEKTVYRLNSKFAFDNRNKLPLFIVELNDEGVFLAKEENNNPCKLTVYYSLALTFNNKNQAEIFITKIENTSKFSLKVREIK